jgi:hypothetical protein
VEAACESECDADGTSHLPPDVPDDMRFSAIPVGLRGVQLGAGPKPWISSFAPRSRGSP